MNEELAYSQALQELNAETRAPGAWAKAMAYGNGDIENQKRLYLKFRSRQLRKEYWLARMNFLKLFSFAGRTRPLSYVFLIVALILGLALMDNASSDIIPIIVPLYAWVFFAGTVRRIRDAIAPAHTVDGM